MNKIPNYFIVILMVFCLTLGFFAGSFLEKTNIYSHFEDFARDYMVKKYMEQKNAPKQLVKGLRNPFKSGNSRPSPKERIAKDLNLTPDQINRITEIIKQNDPDIRAIRMQFYTKLSEKFEAVQKQMAAVLDTQQVEKFKKMPQPSDLARMELYFLSDGNPESNQ